MKKSIILTACLAILAPMLFPSQDTDYYSYSYARLSSVVGDVFIQRAADSDYEEGTVNLPLIEGDKLGAEEGRAEIHFGRKNFIRLDRYTHIDLNRLPRKGDDRVIIHLISGSVYLRVSEMDREKDFAVHTPDASYYILTEGLYSLSVRKAGETEFQAMEGSAEAAGEERSLLIEEGERILASGGRFPSDPGAIYAADGDDFWDWNRSRDELIVRRVTASHLPSELEDYETELADNGRWVNEQPYGSVWVPYVSDNGWRPYHNGRWVWYPVIGWTWVSYDSWGWCVTHYGRWHWRNSLGWYWIPTRHWGPAWVHWYGGADYVGWCPLSYYGYPAVIIDNHFYGRYYHRNYPIHSRALTVIHRTHLRSRHVSRVALTRGQVSRLGRISLSARQPHAAGIGSGISHVRAEKALARSRLRRVTNAYPGRSSIGSHGRTRSPAAKSPTRGISSTWNRISGSRTKTSVVRSRPGSIGRASLRNSSGSPSIPKFRSRDTAVSRARSSVPRDTYPARISRSSARPGGNSSRMPGSSRLRSEGIRQTAPSNRPENRVSSSDRRSFSSRRISSPVRSRSGTSSISRPSIGSGRTRSITGKKTVTRRSAVRAPSGNISRRSSSRGVVSRSTSGKARSSRGSSRVSSRSVSRSTGRSGSSIRSRSTSPSRSSGTRRSSSRSLRRR